MRRVLPIAIVVVLAAVVVFVALRRGEPMDALTAPVEKLLREGDVAGARAERESVRGRADAATNDYLEGVFLLVDGKVREAADVLDRARRADTKRWRTASTAASAMADCGRFADALAVVDGYAAAVPDDERGLMDVARYRLDDRFGPPDAAKALAALDRIAALPHRVAAPDDPTAVSDALLHRLRAKALVLADRGVEAIQEARAATQAAPQDAETWYLLGDAARQARPPHGEESLDAYERAFRLAPRNRRYVEQLVMATLKFVVPGTEAQRFAVARAAVESSLQTSPDDPSLLILKARLFARDAGTLDAANDIYAELQKRKLPKDLRLQVLRNRGVLLYDWKVGGQPGVYLKDAYDLLKEYLDEGGVVDDDLRDPWSRLQRYAEKR